MNIHVDCSASRDCVNIYSYGTICVHCGCCSRNPNYRDMIRRRVKLYKEKLEDNRNFSLWSDDEYWRTVQEKNLKTNTLYCKRKIRKYKKILRTLKVR